MSRLKRNELEKKMHDAIRLHVRFTTAAEAAAKIAVEEIKAAFSAGAARATFNGRPGYKDAPDIENYLKQKGYE
jgi:hypothetical protein